MKRKGLPLAADCRLLRNPQSAVRSPPSASLNHPRSGDVTQNPVHVNP